jgi:putative SOS response-associated peptidase YedK
MPAENYIGAMCGRVIQSTGPLRYAIVDGMSVRDSRVHNYPPRWNAAPSQELLVIRRNHKTGEVSLDPLRWGLIPYWCTDPAGGRKPINAKCETVWDLPAIITTDSNELVADIHDRMPVILAPRDCARWLSEEPDPRDLMRPFPAELMRMWPISTRVNKPENDDPSILEPIEVAMHVA